MGSKNRIAKHILPIILKDRKEGQWYVEPFCGGCNTLDKVKGNRIGGDANKYLVALWKGLVSGLRGPLVIDKTLYDRARTEYNCRSKKGLMSDFEVGYIGFSASFNGRFFDGGYSGDSGGRNYIAEQIRNISQQIDSLRGVDFRGCDYRNLIAPPRSIIYCDPPYADTKQYAISKNFDHTDFWQWCREMSAEGHSVFVSEYAAPMDFEVVWSRAITNSMHPTKTKEATEKLFKYSPVFNELD